ncbi:MAG: YggS family pyridoxal phosphate-dependent enzyme [Candidatus Cloacimonadaceae bacterium]
MKCYDFQEDKVVQKMEMTVLADNISRVKDSIAAAAVKSGVRADDILLVAVTKTHSAETVNLALQAGITHFGENKVQEAAQKLPLIIEPYDGFHFIGHLQTNKVKALLQLNPCLIHSVDSLHLAREIDKIAGNLIKKQEILLQVNTSGEDCKSGCEPAELIALVTAVSELPNLVIKGLMTIGRLSESAEDSRQDFNLLKKLSADLKAQNISGLDLKWLSMGMTSDYQIAIEEGANLVRIGSAIFGERHYNNEN